MKILLISAMLLMPQLSFAIQIPKGSLLQPPAVIAISTTTSAAIPTGGTSLVGVMMPAAFTGTAISFTASNTLAGTYNAVVNAAGAVSYPAAASQYVAIDPKDFQGITFLKIVSNGTEAAARTLVCSLKGI